MNSVNLVGRLTKNIELQHLQSGKDVGRFSLAVNRQYKNQDGEREADFINCVVWGQLAETMSRHLFKGSQVAITGRLQTGSYTNKSGEKRYTTDVVVESFTFTESSSKRQDYVSVEIPPEITTDHYYLP